MNIVYVLVPLGFFVFAFATILVMLLPELNLSNRRLRAARSRIKELEQENEVLTKRLDGTHQN